LQVLRHEKEMVKKIDIYGIELKTVSLYNQTSPVAKSLGIKLPIIDSHLLLVKLLHLFINSNPNFIGNLQLEKLDLPKVG